MKFVAPVLAFGLGVGLLSGCSGGGTKPPPTAKVGGTVTLDGQPMGGGEVRFEAPGQPVKTMEISNGTFSGEAFVGKNHVTVVWDKDGPPNPMNPAEKVKVNAVDPKFASLESPFNPDIGPSGDTSLKFEVKSARK